LTEQYAILSEAERTPTPLRVLKHGDSFAVFDPHGDVIEAPASEHGLFHAGTRFLSRFELLLANRQPLLLSSSISEDNAVFTADLTNPDLVKDGALVVARGLLHLFRSRVLSNGMLIEYLRVTNHALHAIEAPLSFRFDADFADIFEVRGTPRSARGQRLPDLQKSDAVLRYRGLDGVERLTRIRPFRTPDEVDGGLLSFRIWLEPRACADIEIAVSCDVARAEPRFRRFRETLADRRGRLAFDEERACTTFTSNDAFNRWFRRSAADLRMMMTETPFGAYPYAGIPWFSTPFGRDGIITALELLWAWPEVARGVLAFLAKTQATSGNDAQDAQPGKILHEMRDGEMAALGEIPFGRYYGSADATPLFVVLARAYYERTGDLAFIDRLWPHLLAALEWMNRYGDADRDGFIEYARRSESGLVQQGWKDSWDSVFHADGTLAVPPLALCEIQGYAYAAWHGAAQLAGARGDETQAAEWRHRAAALQSRFGEAFWCEDLGTYALALDANKRPCRVRTSNPGHCLFAGIASPQHARRIAETLMSYDAFGGWGVRTVASGTPRYNPMSYHNGSVWPHDNALIAAGLSRYGFTTEASRVFTAMFDLSQAVDLHRLPELICGFHRRSGDAPTLYPVACAPQVWAAGAVYLLMQACLGMRVDACARRVSFTRAVLPEAIDWLRIMNLSIGQGSVDLLLTRHAHDVRVSVLRREGDVAIAAESAEGGRDDQGRGRNRT
jgi:glycogen debranching enzyme